MNKVKIELAHCYGIKKFEYEFDLGINDKSQGVYAIYAPNGYMKSSFARTMQDFSEKKQSKDLIFPDRNSKQAIEGLISENVFVVNPYEESYSSKQITTLLVNETLKRQYDDTLKDIELKKTELLKELSSLSGISNRNNNLEQTILEIFGNGKDTFLQIITSLDIQQEINSQLADIKYKDIINDKTLKILSQSNFVEKLENYVDTYNKLIEQSPILCKTFNHQNANTISKNLNDTGFFSASHSVNLNIGEVKEEFSTLETLKEKIQSEENKIFEDEELKQSFASIDKSLSNNETRTLREILSDNSFLIVELNNINEFKRNIWLAYFQKALSEFEALKNSYLTSQDTISDILAQANNEENDWYSVVNLFNKRFDVPFTLKIENQSDVILNETAPTISFTFKDSDEIKTVEKKTLLSVLSQGERRALYLLNVLFEIEAIKKQGNNTLLILDDIADSFDYKNKYAIVEYTKELAELNPFRVIFLTHNFDFYRTIASRLAIPRQKRLFAIKTNDEVLLRKELYQNDVFKYWKQELNKNIKYQIAFIPFVRNIAEYSGLENEMNKLTNLLHIKQGSNQVTFNQMIDCMKKVIHDLPSIDDNSNLVIESLYLEADKLSSEQEIHLELEDKIILAIAIRLKAEEYMIEKLNDDDFVNGISSNQTRELFDKIKANYPSDPTINILDKVNLMTPENIHLNSFMYEPIIDMSSQHLYQLYLEVKRLEI